ncbi:hypothetical protein MINTM005_12920 [Mycobacterium intracellulare]|nr:hypothetical protein MINTM005_12920 [Mycobacterium intracellulare]
MEWQEVGDKRHYRAIGRRGTYDLRNVRDKWELWYRPNERVAGPPPHGFLLYTEGIKYMFQAKRLAEELDAEE